MWGAPRIHGELLMLGIEVSESTVGRYKVRTGRPRWQNWRTFLRNRGDRTALIDLIVVRTISFKLLYALVFSSTHAAATGQARGDRQSERPNGSPIG